MALTPVEIRHMRPPKTLLGGYRRDPTELLLDEIVVNFEDVWRERADLADKVESLEADLLRFRELENLLRTTLVSAEQAAEQLKEHARREATLILNEAHAEEREIQRRAVSENERLVAASRRLRAQLAEALSVLDEEEPAESDKTAEAEPPTQGKDSGWLVVPDADAA
jgi:cell division initiation protein